MKRINLRRITALGVLCAFSFSYAAPAGLAQSMDFSSTAHQVPAASVLPSGSTAIMVGGHNRLVTPTSTLTPAEAVAVKQVLTSGKQGLELGALGNAVGGSFTVSNPGATLGNLVIPDGVKGILNFSRNDTLNIAGNLLDFGALYAVSTSDLVKAASLNALGINVGQGGLLSTVVAPGTLIGGKSTVPNFSLSLNAINDILNAGTIASAGQLNLTAGNFVNSGLIVSNGGSVNFNAPAGKDLVVNNTGGQIQAATDINVRSAGYAGTSTTVLAGGDWFSQHLNVNGGSGVVGINVGNVSGQIATVGDTVHVTAATETLKIGNQCITGDPTFYNKAGNIEITGLVSANQDISIIASGNIFTLPADTGAQISSNGHNVNLIAGAHIDDSVCVGCTSSTSVPPGSPVLSGQTISISAPIGGDTGGNISLTNSVASPLVDTRTSSPQGGNVSLVAFSGATVGTGNIDLGSALIKTSGASVGGSFTAIAGAASSQSLRFGTIQTNGGSVSISSATPVVPGGTITANASGQLSSPITAGTLQNGNIFVNGSIDTGSVYGSGGSVSLATASNTNLLIGGATTNGVTGTIATPGVDTSHYGDVTITDMGNSSTTVTFGNSIAARNVSVTASTVSVANGSIITAYGTNGSNGIVTLASNGNDAGMSINNFATIGGQFNVTSSVLTAIKAGTLLLKDPTNFKIQSALDISSATGRNYNLSMIGTSPSAQFLGNNQQITAGDRSVTIVAGGGIGTAAGTGFRIFANPSSGNAGSITLVSGKDIGNSTGIFQFISASSTGNSGNITMVAGADNVTVAGDGSSVQINTNSGAAAGGSIIIPALAFSNQLYTTSFSSGGHGGDISLIAMPGTTADSGQVNVAAASNAFIEAGSISGSAGNITIIAGAPSTATAGGGTGYTITTGPIGTNYGAGDILVSTAVPNTPVTINTVGTNATAGGSITSGTFMGGAPVDGAISVFAISNFSTSPAVSGGNTITLLAGSNALNTTSNAINVNNIQASSSTSRSIDISLITGVAGTANVATHGYSINTGFIQGNGSNTSLYVSSADSISIGVDSFGRSIIAGGKPITLLAGTGSTPGNISIGGSTLVGGGANIAIASLGTVGNIFLGGTGGNGSINTSSGNTGGSVAVTTLNGTITATGHIATIGNLTNGDVLLSSGSAAATSITIATDAFGIVTGLSNSATPLPGQIYIVTNSSSSQSNVSTSNTTQSANGRAANPVKVALGNPFFIASGLRSIVFTPDNIAAGQTGNVTGYSPGGFTNISDSTGASDIQISIAGNITDNKLIVPIVSAGGISLGNNAGSKVEVLGSSKGVPNLFFAGSGVALGIGVTPVSLTANALGSYTSDIASNNGAVNVRNLTGPLNLLSVVSNQAISLTNMNGAINVLAPQVSPLADGIAGNTTIALGGSIFAPQSITINTSGGAISHSSGALTTSSLLLTASGDIGGSAVGALLVTSAPSISINTIPGVANYLNVLNSTNVTFSGGTRTTLRIDESGYGSVLNVNAVSANTLLLQAATGTGATVNLNGAISGASSATISADYNITNAVGAGLTYPSISLTATGGDIASSSRPLSFGNGGSGTAIFVTAGKNFYGSDSSSDTVTLNNSASSLAAGSSFQLSTVGNIQSVTGAQAITSPVLSLTSGGSITGLSGTSLAVASGTNSTLSMFVSTGASGTASLSDSSNDNIVLQNGVATPSAASLLLTLVGNLTAQNSGAAAFNAPGMQIVSLAGNIGAFGTPLILSSGTVSANMALSAVAVGTSSGNGNVYIQVPDSDLGPAAAVVVSGQAGSGSAVDSSTGNFQLTTSQGSIAVLGTLSATTNVNLIANKSITGSTISSPLISLTTPNGNIGASSASPLVLSGGGFAPGVQAFATANTSGFGNVWITSTDSHGLNLQSVLAGSGGAADATNGNVQATANGTITVGGNAIGTNSVTLQGTDIKFNGVLVGAPTVNLTATTGGIGTFSSPVIYSAGTLNITATDPTLGQAYISTQTGVIGLGAVNVGNLLYITVPGTVDVSALSPFSSIPNLGLISSGGSITIGTDLTTTNSLYLGAAGNIVRTGAFTLSSNVVFLNSAAGNIGSAAVPVLVGNSGSSVSVLATATANTSGNGNIYIEDDDSDPVGSSALFVETSTAGSGTPVDATTGNFSAKATNGSIDIDGNVSGSTSVSLDSGVDITRSAGSNTLISQSVALTANTGNIGSSAAPVLVASTGPGLHLTANADANTSGNGNVYIVDSDSDPVGSSALYVGNSGAGSGTPVDATTGTFAVTTTNGSMTVEGDVSASLTMILSADGSIARTGSSTLSSSSVNLNATRGNIGSSVSPMLLSAPNSTVFVAANALANTSGNGNVYLRDDDSDPVGGSALNLIGSSAGSGTPVDATTGNFVATAGNGSIDIRGNVAGSSLMNLNADQSISRFGSHTVTAPVTTLNASNGNIGSSALPLFVAGTGSGLSVTATANANTSGNGNVYLQNDDSDPVGSSAVSIATSSAGSGTPVDSTTGNFSVIASNGSINIGGAVSATTDLSLQAANSINQSAGSVSAPQVDLTATQGGIGSPTQRVHFSGGTVNVSAADSTNGKVYLESADTAFTFGTVTVGNLFNLQVDQTVGLSKLTPAASTPSLVLIANGVNADINQDAPLSVGSITLVAGRSINGGGAVNATSADSFDLTAGAGNIGTSGSPLRLQARSNVGYDLTASATSNTSGNGNIFVLTNDTFSNHRLHAIAAGSGTPVDSTTGQLDFQSSSNTIISDTISASRVVRISTGSNVTASTASGSPLIVSPDVRIIALNGDISTTGPSTTTVAFGNNGNGVKIYAYAAGSASLVDNTQEAVTINNFSLGPTTLQGGTAFKLTTNGSMSVADNTGVAISSPNIQLIAIGGNITADGTTGGGAVLVDSRSNPSGLLLNVHASQVAGVGGVVNIKDLSAENIVLQNSTAVPSSAPVLADVAITLTSNGNILAENASIAAIESPAITLVTIGGNVSGDGTVNGAPLIVESPTTTGVILTTNGTPVAGSGGNFNIRINGEAVTLQNSTASLIQLFDDTSVTASNVTAGSVFITTPQLAATGTVTSNSGSGALVINGINGQGLALSGAGSLNAANVISLNVGGSDSINFAGGPTLNGNTIMNAIGGGINVTGGPIAVNGNLTVNVNNTFNVADFTVSGTETINFPASGVSLGTLVNTTGDVILGKQTIINSGGKNIAIIAAGNVTANGATTINLSSSKTSGGSLTIIAGYDFTPGSGGQILDPTTGYLLGTTSTNGGNINLPKLTVNTSSTAASSAGGKAGDILMVAGAGDKAAGSIVVGGLTATSKNAGGGNVSLFAPGGVIVNGSITTTGKTTGGAVTLVGAQPTIVGSIVVQDGYVTGGVIAPGTPTANAGAAILVTGTIKTGGTTSNGGAVTLLADQQVSSGAITATGINGGSVLLQSLGAYVKTGAIATNALNVKTGTAAGNGGNIQINAQTLISTGNLVANGGTNAGTGDGGDGGDVSLATALQLNPLTSQNVNIGTINVKGFINTAGGNVAKGAMASGGEGGDVTIDAGAVAITGATAGSSILASDGIAPGAAVTAGGNVNISTYSVQPLPTALDLTSTTKNIVALPGGMFSVGTGGSPNGVSGTIKSNQVMTKAVAPNGFILNGTTSVGNVHVTVHGVDGSITENGDPTPITILTGTKRTMISPAEALALWQTSRGVNQDLTVTSSSSTKGGVATGGSATIDQANVGGTSFTAFKLPTNVTLEFTGARSVVNLPASTLLNGTINFSSLNSVNYLNADKGALTINSTASVTADSSSTLILSGTGATWTNNGILSAGDIVLARPGTGALAFKANGTASQTSAFEFLIDPSANGSSTMSFTANGVGSLANQFEFFTVPMPTMYTANAQATATGASKLPSASLTFSLSKANGPTNDPIEARVLGNLNASTLTVKGVANTFNKVTVQTPVTISDANLSATTTMNISTTGALKVNASVLTAGVLQSGTVLTAPIPATAIVSKGSLTLTGATGIQFVGISTLTNEGALLKMTATGAGANVDLGDHNNFNDNGGSISILAKGNVLGGATNAFNAVGTVGTATGGIELASGTTTSSLSKAFGMKPTTSPSAPGALITPNANGKQVLFLPSGTTGVSLGGTGTESTLNFTGQGVMVFNAVGGSSITLQQSTFTTVSSKPVGLTSTGNSEAVEEFVVDTDYDSAIDSEFVTLKR